MSRDPCLTLKRLHLQSLVWPASVCGVCPRVRDTERRGNPEDAVLYSGTKA